MLEKIGLPPKPSLRGNNWVVDASNCQGCSSQFTFINRKHHCRRCGGIFCGSCTQQRMFLRGQGESPVRICEPCKKLEEAARFEMRYGHKNKAAKGGSKLASKNEDQLLDSASCSSIQHSGTPVEGSDIVRSLSLDQPTDMLAELDSSTPEDLRQQAVVEKAKYKTLKAEGKSEEALRAFKRGKELERQAAALAISLRKNRRKALSSSSMNDIQQKEDLKPSSGINKEKDDISAELGELGWSDVDIRESDKKPASLTLEGELSSLIREVSQKPNNKEKQVVSSDKSQVIAHKKRALELKRAGNLIEAKEELKRAKILERKIEEEELLGGADDDSDDELSALIRSMDGDDDDDLSSTYKKSDIDFNINHSDDFGVDGSLEVTDEDLEDPEMASALKSLGWTEEDIADSEDLHVSVSSSSKKEFKKESLATEIQSLKREALNQKRAGNTAEAMALLKKAKTLEMELENSDDSRGSKEETLIHMRKNVDVGPRMAPKNKLAIQKELIALKKKALALRREGRVDESEEELKKAKVLEEQLEDMNKAPTVSQSSIGNKAPGNEDDEEVTDQDLHDPSYLSLLKNLGWEDEDNAEVKSSILKENNSVSSSTSISFNTQPVSNVEDVKSRKSKGEIQRELLALKRKALALRRQGDTEAADEVLKNATSLEEQLQEYEEPKQREVSSENDAENANVNAKSSLHEKDKVVRDEKPEERVNKNENLQIQESNPSQEILAHKRKALALKREGKLAEAKEELRLAKLLEKRAEEDATKSASSNSGNNTSTSDSPSTKKPDSSPGSVSKPLSSRDRFKMQQESLGHKRQALKLRREGKTAEADAEFELAKALEAQLQELDSHESKSSEPDGVSVEDFLDPQLLSALQSIGLEDVRTTSTSQPESVKSSADDANNSNIEKEQLMQRIKAEKVKAVNLKRSGKQAEALDALRRAKLYEKKLESLSS